MLEMLEITDSLAGLFNNITPVDVMLFLVISSVFIFLIYRLAIKQIKKKRLKALSTQIKHPYTPGYSKFNPTKKPRKHLGGKLSVQDVADLPDSTALPYQLKPYLLSDREFAFYCLLSEICESKNIKAYAKVRLADIFTLPENFKEKQGEDAFWFYFGPLAKKHVDFLLVDQHGQFICGIEVDDATHDSELAARNDLIKDRIFLSARLPLYRFRRFGQDSILEAINDACERHEKKNSDLK